MKKRLLSLLSLSMVGLFALASCQSGSSTPTSDSTSTSEVSLSISIDKSSIAVGETAQVTISISGQGVATLTSSDNTVATVNNDGVVTAIKAGSVTITATMGQLTDTVGLTVTDTRLGVQALGTALANTPYSDSTITTADTYGLSDANAVGVDESETTKVYYPVRATADVVIEVNSLTIEDVKTVMPSETVLNDYNKIQGAILLAKVQNDSDKSVNIHLDGEYLVDSSLATTAQVFAVDGLNDTYLYGTNDATITLQTRDMNYKGYFAVSNCTEFHMNDIKLQMEVPPSMVGVVSSADVSARSITLDIDPEFNSLCEKVIGVGTNPRIESYLEFSSITNAPLEGGNFKVGNVSSYSLTKPGENYQIVLNFNEAITRPGRGDYGVMQFTQYNAAGVTTNNSSDIYYENLTMHHAAGMGFVSGYTSDLFVNRFNLTIPEGSKALMTSTADAMHLQTMGGEVTITNSIIENSHDDALNIKHGYFYTVSRVNGPSRQITINKLTGSILTPIVGDTIEVYNEDTFESHNPIQGAYTITGVSGNDTSYVLTVQERMSDVASWGNCRATLTSRTPQVTFKNNIVRNKRNRGLLIQVPGAVVENNTFQNVGHGSIQAATAMDIYNECTLPYDVSIKNNKFINNCYLTPEPLYGDISIFAISKNATVAPKGTITGAVIENNFFSANGNSPISLRGVGDVDITSNLFYECSRIWPSGEINNNLMAINNSSEITVENNWNEYTLDLGLSGIYLQGMATEDDITLNGNHDISFYDAGEAGPEVNVGRATGAITIDGDLSEWSTIGATSIEMIAYSTAEGIEIEESAFESFFKVNQFLLTYSDEGIYVAFDVYDNKLDFKTTSDFWIGDCVEVFLSTVTNMPNADLGVYRNDGGVMQAAFAPTWANNYTLGNTRTNDDYLSNANVITASVVTNDSGYTGEFFIAFEHAPEFKSAIDAGERIDIAFIVADAERDSNKRIQGGNVPHFVEQYKTNTAKMPQYLFN